MTSIRIMTACAIGIIATTPAGAQTTAGSYPADWRDRREFVYFLTGTRAAVAVAQRIERCPARAGDEPGIVTSVAIGDRTFADPDGIVRVDARSGFLAERTTKLGLRADGTLETFNASTEGQGGDVVAAVVKTAASIAAASVGVPIVPGAARMLEKSMTSSRPPALRCRDDIGDKIDKLAQLRSDIADIESKVARGDADGEQIALLGRHRQTADDIEAELTLTGSADLRPVRANGTNLTRLIPALDHAIWFEPDAPRVALAKLEGANGFRVTLAADAAMLALLKGDGSMLPAQGATPYLFYRRPVPATVAVAPCGSRPSGEECTPATGAAADRLSASRVIPFAQLSGLYAIPIGRGGMFGSRQAAAKFDARGAPLELEYGSGGVGPVAAQLVEAFDSARTTLRDAERNAVTRKTEDLEALHALKEALAK